MSKVLLIDDEEPIRKILGLYLRSKGYEVITAADGRGGIELFQRESPAIVLTDIKMPGMDGIEVLKKIKAIRPEAEVIVITGHGDMNLSIHALQLDASDFITKPVANEALSVALKRAEERLDTRTRLRKYTTNLENKAKEATEELRERYEFEGNLIRHSIDGIIATDKQGNIITFNQGAGDIFGYSKDEVIGKMDITSLYPAGIAKEIRQNLYGKDPETQGAHAWRQTFILGKNGHKIPVRFSGALLYRDVEVIGSVGFFHDLREVKRLEQELIKSERLAAIGQTTAGLAHCIKNILVGLQGGVYIVDKGLSKDGLSQVETGWDMVRRNIGRISSLAMDLLNYSKEREPEYEVCSPNAIADEVCELMDPKAKEFGVRIVKDLDPTIGEVSIDPKGVHRCLLNIVSNAVDACTSDEDQAKEHRVQVATRLETGGTLTFRVSDNGCGMNDAVRRQIFGSLFSTKGSAGTGLGLLVTQKIVQEQGGTISVASHLGRGSTFTIRVPCEVQEE